MMSVLVTQLFAADIAVADIRAVGLQPVKEGTKILDFELEDLEGAKRKLSDYKGKVVFLNFWATWCPPCRAEMPSMQALYDRFKDQGLEILAVDLREGPDLVRTFMKEHELDFPVLLDRSGQVGGTYGVRSIPTTYLIDRDGTILAGRIGAQEWDGDEIMRFFERLLQE
jgi:peroxiredoxin